MKKILLSIAILMLAITGYTHPVNTNQYDVVYTNTPSDWKDFSWNWSSASDQALVFDFYGTRPSNLFFRLSKPDGSYYLTTQAGTFSDATEYRRWYSSLDKTNIPPSNVYRAELLSSSDSSTNIEEATTLVMARGRVVVQWSSYDGYPAGYTSVWVVGDGWFEEQDLLALSALSTSTAELYQAISALEATNAAQHAYIESLISAEAVLRGTQITNEAIARAAGDASVLTNTAAMIFAASNSLRSAIEAEASARTSADSAISTSFYGKAESDGRYIKSTNPVVSGTITGPDYIQMNTNFSDGHSTGRIQWNSEDGTLDVGMVGTNVNLQIGQELLVRARNVYGSTISNGMVVALNGQQGQANPTVNLADADSTNASLRRVLGMATEDIPNNEFGYITIAGLVRDVNTIGNDVGAAIYLSTNAGRWTSVQPVAPQDSIMVGNIIKTNANGIILIKPELPSRSWAELDARYATGTSSGVESDPIYTASTGATAASFAERPTGAGVTSIVNSLAYSLASGTGLAGRVTAIEGAGYISNASTWSAYSPTQVVDFAGNSVLGIPSISFGLNSAALIEFDGNTICGLYPWEFSLQPIIPGYLQTTQQYNLALGTNAPPEWTSQPSLLAVSNGVIAVGVVATTALATAQAAQNQASNFTASGWSTYPATNTVYLSSTNFASAVVGTSYVTRSASLTDSYFSKGIAFDAVYFGEKVRGALVGFPKAIDGLRSYGSYPAWITGGAGSEQVSTNYFLGDWNFSQSTYLTVASAQTNYYRITTTVAPSSTYSGAYGQINIFTNDATSSWLRVYDHTAGKWRRVMLVDFE